jgi:hypothetical protein
MLESAARREPEEALLCEMTRSKSKRPGLLKLRHPKKSGIEGQGDAQSFLLQAFPQM